MLIPRAPIVNGGPNLMNDDGLVNKSGEWSVMLSSLN